MYIEKISQVIPVPYNIFIFGYKLFNVTPACCAVNRALFFSWLLLRGLCCIFQYLLKYRNIGTRHFLKKYQLLSENPSSF